MWHAPCNYAAITRIASFTRRSQRGGMQAVPRSVIHIIQE